MEMSLGRKLVFSVFTVVFVAALLECGARLFYHPDTETVYEEHQQIIDVLGLSELNETMVFDPVLFWKLKPNLRRQRVSGQVRDQLIDFEVTTNSRGYRSPEVRSDRERFRVLALGNSCTFGLGVDDDETWPVRLEQALRRTVGPAAEVINAGVPGYTSYQGKKFLERAGLALSPDLVIITFGFNDADVWSSRSDEQTGRLLRMKELEGVLHKSRFYQVLVHLLRRDAEEEREPAVEKDLEKRARVSAADLEANMIEMKEMCAAREVPVIFLIWPYRKQVEEKMGELIIFQPIVVNASEKTATPVINLYEPFLHAGEEPVLDHVHATPAGCLLVAETVAAILEQARIR